MVNKKTIGFVTIIGLLSITSFFSINLYFQQRSQHDELDITTFPYQVGDWKGKDLEIEELTYQILQTRNLIVREYTNPEGKRIVLSIVYSEKDRAVFHPPEVCLMGSGIEILDKKTEMIKGFKGETIFANKIYLDNNGRRNISLYCYKVGNFYTENFYLQQISKGVRGATIHAHIPLLEDEQAAMPMLKDFFRESATIIDRL